MLSAVLGVTKGEAGLVQPNTAVTPDPVPTEKKIKPVSIRDLTKSVAISHFLRDCLQGSGCREEP